MRRLVAEIVGGEPGAIALDQRIVQDIGMLSDDFTFDLVRDVEAEFDIHPPVSDWRHVSTVGDLVGLVERWSER